MFLSYTPWKHQKTYVFTGYKVVTLGLIMMTLIYAKQIIHVNDPVDETVSLPVIGLFWC